MCGPLVKVTLTQCAACCTLITREYMVDTHLFLNRYKMPYLLSHFTIVYMGIEEQAAVYILCVSYTPFVYQLVRIKSQLYRACFECLSIFDVSSTESCCKPRMTLCSKRVRFRF